MFVLYIYIYIDGWMDGWKLVANMFPESKVAICVMDCIWCVDKAQVFYCIVKLKLKMNNNHVENINSNIT